MLCRGRAANAHSTTALMSLGVHRGDTIEVIARGSDAQGAIAALEGLLGPAIAVVPAPPKVEPRSVPAPTTQSGEVTGVMAVPGLALGAVVQRAQAALDVKEEASDPAAEERIWKRRAARAVASNRTSSPPMSS